MRANTFYVDGHLIEVEMVRRGSYEGKLNGDRIIKGGTANSIREDLITEAHYRPDREPDFAEMAEVIFDFVHQHTKDGKDEDWVTREVVTKELFPENQFDINHMKVLNALVDEGDLNELKVYGVNGPTRIYRALP